MTPKTAINDLRIGTKVLVKQKFVRRERYNPKDLSWDKTWEVETVKKPYIAYVVGIRKIQNGRSGYGGGEVIVWWPEKYITAIQVTTSIRVNPHNVPFTGIDVDE